MGIPVKSRWWVVTLLVVGVLMLISALALDRPDVVWDAGMPHCPNCRHAVAGYSRKCSDCGSDYDWTIAPKEQGPLSLDSLSLLEAEWVHGRVKELGKEKAAQLVAEAVGLGPEAALAYIETVGRGDCGWCGGTKKDLAAPDLAAADPCPCCLGTGDSIACGGDRHPRVGDPTAHRALAVYEGALADLQRSARVVPAARRVEEARALAEEFLRLHAGSLEASRIRWWEDLAGPQPGDGGAPRAARTVTRVARARLDRALEALQARP